MNSRYHFLFHFLSYFFYLGLLLFFSSFPSPTSSEGPNTWLAGILAAGILATMDIASFCLKAVWWFLSHSVYSTIGDAEDDMGRSANYYWESHEPFLFLTSRGGVDGYFRPSTMV